MKSSKRHVTSLLSLIFLLKVILVQKTTCKKVNAKSCTCIAQIETKNHHKLLKKFRKLKGKKIPFVVFSQNLRLL